MLYALQGFLNPSASASTFIFPCFSKRDSNLLFTQQLDESGHIVYFMEVSTDKYSWIDYLKSPVNRRVGDPGFYGCLVDNVIYDGEKDELIEAASSTVRLSSGHPFFKMEFSRFSQSRSLMNVARRDCLRLIENERISKIYAALMRVTPKKIAQDKRPSVDVLDFLRTDFHQLDWLNVWVKAWNSSSDKVGLSNLAMQFFLVNADMPLDLISSSALRKLIRFFPDSVEWVLIIEKKLSTSSPDKHWSALWLTYANRLRRDNRVSFDLGFEFLTTTMKSSEIELTSAWSDIWLRLWNLGADRSYLGELAEVTLQKFPLINRFIASVVMPLAKSDLHQQNRALMTLNYWVSESQTASNLWAAAFGLILDRIPSEETIDIGRKWLKRHTEISKWAEVWLSIKPYIAEGEFNELGQLWLIRAREDMHVRPIIISELLSSAEVDKKTVDTAEEWLRLADTEKGSPKVRKVKSQYKTKISGLVHEAKRTPRF